MQFPEARPLNIPALAGLLDHANDLKLLPRTGWLFAGIQPPESVADHSYVTALLALALAEAINTEPAAHGLAQRLDVARVVRIALLHDLAESVVTDLPKRSVALLGESAKHAAEAHALSAMTARLPGGGEWLALWREYDAGSSPEARLVRDADKLEMTHQAVRYTQQGRRGLDDFLTERNYTFALCRDIHAHLCRAVE